MNDQDRYHLASEYLSKSRIDFALNYLDFLLKSSLLGPRTSDLAINTFLKHKLWIKIVAVYENSIIAGFDLPLKCQITACNAYIALRDLAKATEVLDIAERQEPFSEAIISRRVAICIQSGKDSYFHDRLMMTAPNSPHCIPLLIAYCNLLTPLADQVSPDVIYTKHSERILLNQAIAGCFAAYFLNTYQFSLLEAILSLVFSESSICSGGPKVFYHKYKHFIEQFNNIDTSNLNRFADLVRVRLRDCQKNKMVLSFIINTFFTCILERHGTRQVDHQYGEKTENTNPCSFRSIDSSSVINRSSLSNIFQSLSSDTGFVDRCNPRSATLVLQRFIRYKCNTSSFLGGLPVPYITGCVYSLLFSDWHTYYPLRFWVRLLKKKMQGNPSKFTLEFDGPTIQLAHRSKSAHDEISQAWPLMLAHLFGKNKIPFRLAISYALQKACVYPRITLLPPAMLMNSSDLTTLKFIRQSKSQDSKVRYSEHSQESSLTLLSRIRHIDQLVLRGSRQVIGISCYLDRHGNPTPNLLDINCDLDISITPRFHPCALSFPIQRADLVNQKDTDSPHSITADIFCFIAKNFLELISSLLSRRLASILCNARALLGSGYFKAVNLGEGFCIESQALLQASSEINASHSVVWPHSINPSYFSFLYGDLKIKSFAVCSRSGHEHIESVFKNAKRSPRVLRCNSGLIRPAKTLTLRPSVDQLNVIIIGNDTHISLAPLALLTRVVESTFQLTSSLAELDSVNFYYKPKNNASSSVAAFARIAYSGFRFKVISTKLSDISLPMSLFVGIGVASNALLECVGMGFPSAIVDVHIAQQYVISPESLPLSISSDKARSEISRLRHWSHYCELIDKQRRIFNKDFDL